MDIEKYENMRQEKPMILSFGCLRI